MKRITEVTRRDLFDIIQEGFDKEVDSLEYEPLYDRMMPSSKTVHISMPYCGRFSEIDFLDRLYHLDEMPSTDRRFSNAKGDIYCHTVSFNDWPEYWFLDDDRFELKDGFDDEPLLKFLCEMLHPAVRNEDGPWKDYLDRFNQLLRQDGYEMYPSYKISGRDIYKYHEYIPMPVIFDESMLFTRRYCGLVQTDNNTPVDLICADVTKKAKKSLISALIEFSQLQKWKPNRYDNYEITTDAMFMALQRLNEVHETPVVALDETGPFGNRYSTRLESIFNPLLFDLIELQHEELSDTERTPFREKINSIFRQAHLCFSLTERGMIEQIVVHEVLNNTIGQNIGAVKEVGLRDLLDQAIALHQRPDNAAHKDAMEKIWDALERLKTYYTSLDKKASASKIVNDMANSDSSFIELFSSEFKALTDIGNNYRIRHHETDKVDITDPRHYDYFFNRCLSLIALAIQYLQ